MGREIAIRPKTIVEPHNEKLDRQHYNLPFNQKLIRSTITFGGLRSGAISRKKDGRTLILYCEDKILLYPLLGSPRRQIDLRDALVDDLIYEARVYQSSQEGFRKLVVYLPVDKERYNWTSGQPLPTIINPDDILLKYKRLSSRPPKDKNVASSKGKNLLAQSIDPDVSERLPLRQPDLTSIDTIKSAVYILSESDLPKSLWTQPYEKDELEAELENDEDTTKEVTVQSTVAIENGKGPIVSLKERNSLVNQLKAELAATYNVQVESVPTDELYISDATMMRGINEGVFFISEQSPELTYLATSQVLKYRQLKNELLLTDPTKSMNIDLKDRAMLLLEEAHRRKSEKADQTADELGVKIDAVRNQLRMNGNGKEPSLDKIADALNQAKVLTPTGKPKWYAQTVKRVIERSGRER